MDHNTKLFVSRVVRTLNWRIAVESGEMIEQRANGMEYCKDHLSHCTSPLSQRDLDSICNIVNTTFYECGSDLMVENSGGVFVPARRLYRSIGG